MRAARLVLLALTVVACSGGPSATSIIVYVTPPPSTAAAPTAAGPDSSNLVPDDAVLRVWSSQGYVTSQVITRIHNTGATWIELLQSDSVWTIFDAIGGIVATRDSVVVGPRYLAPGETGYVASGDFADEHPRDDYDHAQMDVHFDEVIPQDRLTVDNFQIRNTDVDGIGVTGHITNPGTEKVLSALVLAVFLDAGGSPLGFAYGYADDIEPGRPRAFEISSDFAEIPINEIAETLVYASDL